MHQLSDMSPARRRAEYAVRFLVFYSIICYFLELQLDSGQRSTGMWLWNERLIASFFTLEYLIRWFTSDNRRTYPFKLLSVIDLLAILPFYIGFFVDEKTLGVIRTLRILRLFKLVRYSPALLNIFHGLRKVRGELGVVGYVVVIVVLFSSALMYELEHAAQPDKFEKPADAVWWCFVTLTTVGYGDLAPVTFAGRIVGVATMIIGIGIFGVFVSIVGSAFLADLKNKEHSDEHGTTGGDVPGPHDQNGVGGKPDVHSETGVGVGGNSGQEQK